MDQFLTDLSQFSEDSKEYKFFEALFNKIGSSFISEVVEKEVKQVQYASNKAMKQYFELYIIFHAVVNAVESLDKEESGLSDNKAPVVCVHPFYFNIVKRYLLSTESSDSLKLLELSEEFVSKICRKRQMSEPEHLYYLKCVQYNIDEFCQKLIEYVGHNATPGQDWRSTFQDVIKDLESKADLLQRQEVDEPKEVSDMLLTYYKELLEGLSMLNRLLFLYEQKLNFEGDAAEYYCGRSKLLSLKIKMLKLKILEATYDEKTIPALKIISDQLETKKEKLEEEFKEKTSSVKAYEQLGETYEALVEEYTKLTQSIREQKWAVDQMNHMVCRKTDEVTDSK